MMQKTVSPIPMFNVSSAKKIVDPYLDDMKKEVAAETGIHILSRRLYFFDFYSSCQAKKECTIFLAFN